MTMACAVFLLYWMLMCIGQSCANHKPLFRVGILSSNEVYQQSVSLALNQLHSNTSLQMLTPQYENVSNQDTNAILNKACRRIREGIFSLLGQHSVSSASTYHSLTSHLQVPFITTGIPINQSTPHLAIANAVYMKPVFPQALIDLIHWYDWKKVYYMYNDEQGRERFKDLLLKVQSNLEDNGDIQLRLLPVQTAKEAKNIMRRMSSQNKDILKVIVDLRPSVFREYLQLELKVEKTNIQKPSYIWAGLGYDDLLPEELLEGGGLNVSGFSLLDITNTNARQFLDLVKHRTTQQHCEHEAALAYDSVLLMSEAVRELMDYDPNMFELSSKLDSYFKGSEKVDCENQSTWPWQQGPFLVEKLRQTRLSEGLTGEVAFDKNGFRTNFTLNLWSVTVQTGLNKMEAVWDSRNGSISLVSVLRENTTPSPTKRFFNVTSILASPYLIELEDANLQGNDRYIGYCADLAKKLAQDLNFEYLIRPVKDRKYGAQQEDGSWDGMVGELIRKEADIAIAPLTITSVREEVIRFTKPFMKLGISIMLKKMSKQGPGVFSFMYPLSFEIWMSIIFAYLSVSVVLYIVSRLSPYEWHMEDRIDGPTVTNNFTISNSLWYALSAFMQQGSDLEPRSTSGRIVGSVWWFFTLIIISSYTANLAAWLTVERMQTPIETADDLAKQTEIKYGTVKGGSTEEFFKSSSIDVYQRMWAFMSQEQSVFVNTNEEGVNRVRNSSGHYAFLLESPTNEYFNQRKPCDTMKVGHNLDSKGYGIGTPQNFDFRDKLNVAVLELRERGILSEFEKDWWVEKGECGENPSQKPTSTNSLKFNKLAGIFYILIVGLVVAVFIALADFIYQILWETRKKSASAKEALKSKAKLALLGKSTKTKVSRSVQNNVTAQLVTLEDSDNISTTTAL